MDLENLCKFISFRSVSCDDKFEKDLIECCKWLNDYLGSFCRLSKIYETENKPVIVAEVGNGEPVIIYGHYDVQPAEVSDGWNSDPFQAVVRNGRIYGRGAQDNKGQLWYSIQAVKELVNEGNLRKKVVFFIEGEEESGGHGSQNFIIRNYDKIFDNASCVFVTDSGTFSENVESITLGLRGSAGFDLIVKGPGYDLHSGVHGGLAPNPIFDSSYLLQSLSYDRYSQIEGFLDGLLEPTQNELELASKFPLSATEYSNLIGLDKQLRNLSCNFAALGLYPRIECTGISGGYAGKGFKNIIPSRVIIKISLRTAYDQNSEHALNSVINHLLKQRILCSAVVENIYVSSNPIKVPLTHPKVQQLMWTIENTLGNPVVPQWCGATVPIAELFFKRGIIPIIFGFGLEEDQIHGPNESFKLAQFEKGFKVMKRILNTP